MADADRMRCELLVDGAGEVIASARVSPDITDEGRAALAAVIAAASRKFAADLAADPSIAERQEASRARIAERNRRFRESEVRARLEGGE